MVYNPANDFVSISRLTAGKVHKAEMPGLDFVIAALNRSGILNISLSNTAPVANQATTAWFQPAATSYTAEGSFKLWNGAAYVAASMSLLLEMLTKAEALAASTVAISTLLDTLGAAQGDIIARGATSWQVITPGASGTVLTSGGVGVLPSWVASTVPTPSNANPLMDGVAAPGVSALYSRGDHVHPTDTSRAPNASPTFTGVPAAPTNGSPTDNTTQIATDAFVQSAITNALSTVGVIGIQVFTASGTYTPNAAMTACIVEMVGGGGGGGGGTAPGAGIYGGGGGGAGAYSRKFLLKATVGASQTVTVGAGGTGVSGAAGNNGSASSLGVLCTANGGGGGTGLGGTGGVGGTAGTGDVAASGSAGDNGIFINSAATGTTWGGNGGASYFGGAGRAGVSGAGAVAGSAATGFGSGGGAGVINNSSGTPVAGGNGSAGIVIVTEYAH